MESPTDFKAMKIQKPQIGFVSRKIHPEILPMLPKQKLMLSQLTSFEQCRGMH